MCNPAFPEIRAFLAISVPSVFCEVAGLLSVSHPLDRESLLDAHSYRRSIYLTSQEPGSTVSLVGSQLLLESNFPNLHARVVQRTEEQAKLRMRVQCDLEDSTQDLILIEDVRFLKGRTTPQGTSEILIDCGSMLIDTRTLERFHAFWKQKETA